MSASKVMLIGGRFESSQFSTQTLVLDFQKGSITSGPKINIGRQLHSCARIGGQEKKYSCYFSFCNLFLRHPERARLENLPRCEITWLQANDNILIGLGTVALKDIGCLSKVMFEQAQLCRLARNYL